MRMVTDYERSIRESLLAEIRGWRKALALGAAWLAGLAQMKTQAQKPSLGDYHGTTNVSQDDLQYPAFKAGYEDGKVFPRVPGDENEENVREAALLQTARKGYLDQGQETRDYIQGWLDGYVTTHNPETRK